MTEHNTLLTSTRVFELVVLFAMLVAILIGLPEIIEQAKGLKAPVVVSTANTQELNVIVGDKEHPQIQGVLIVSKEASELFLAGPKVWKLVVNEEFKEVE